tara:strand:- start:362 stop:553 length:192 start_codon:yes stop_codon:yes gene_type:complete
MPVQAIAEQDEDGERIVLVLKENEKSMTARETEAYMRRYERNMCPADLYNSENNYVEDQVAPI